MTTQLLLITLFFTTGALAVGTIAASVRHAMPQLRALQAAMAAGDPVREISWRVVNVEVRHQTAPANVLPFRQAALPRHPQTWRAAA